MADLQSLHTKSRKLILMLSAGIERLESAEHSSRGQVSDSFGADLQQQLSQLQKVSVDMDAQWRMQSMREAASKRDLWKRKVEQVAEEADALRVAMDRLGLRHHRRMVEEATRQELMQRRAEGRPAVDLGAEVAARRSVANSKAVLEEAYQSGVGVLSAMTSQRDRLKASHRKVLDVLNGLGLSDSVLRVAERRIGIDKLIAYGGMVLVTGLLIFAYWWLKA